MTGEPSHPETREALAVHLEASGVREGTYQLFGVHLDDAMVMDRRLDGWVVFYSERGREVSSAVHDDEASACADLLARVTAGEHAFFELVAGPAPADEAEAAFDAWLQRRGATREDVAPTDCKYDDVPWTAGPYWRRFFVRIATIRRLQEKH